MTTTSDRARGALLGLAAGDAAGLPAVFHRTVRMSFHRSVLWQFAAEADAQQVLTFPLPFTLGRPEPLALCGTDDAEFAAVSALVLLEDAGAADGDTEALLAGWRRLVVDAGDQVWSGIAERSSIINIRAGLLPPASGNDNPAHYHDSAVARAVPVGVRWPGEPAVAARVATQLALITHAEDGVWAAAAMAAAVAAAMAGATAGEAVAEGRSHVPADSWLGRQVDTAMALAAQADSPFDLAAVLADEVANASYSFGTVAPETLASAFALVTAADGDLGAAVPAAVTVAKQSDSMPAMVGALCGALRGEAAVPRQWRDRVDVLRGLCVPSTEGISLVALADRLMAAGSATSEG